MASEIRTERGRYTDAMRAALFVAGEHQGNLGRQKSDQLDASQDGRCPWCRKHLVALQGKTGPQWFCGCPGREVGSAVTQRKAA